MANQSGDGNGKEDPADTPEAKEQIEKLKEIGKGLRGGKVKDALDKKFGPRDKGGKNDKGGRGK